MALMPPQDHLADARQDSSGLDELVFECLERMDSEGPRALAEICAAHPEHAAALSARLHRLKISGLVESTGDPDTFPEQLDEFRLERRLGRGGMGVVYVARQTSLGRDVALKLIRPEQLYFPGARERFRREVEAVARLAHPGIVPVYTVGEAQGIPYFAMELVSGASLEELLAAFRGRAPDQISGRDLFDLVTRLARERGSPQAGSPSERVFASGWTQACLWIARELAQALEHAHQRGVLHRDIKPSNVMLTPGGRTLLLDFGLASAEGAGRLTRTGSQAGSLPYMAPEQVRGESASVDARTDVYGLGVTLYEMLALAAPFRGRDSAELSKSILDARPQRLRARIHGLPSDVETVVAAAMAPERERRYASAADLARDLSNLLEHRPIQARPAGVRVRTLRWAQRRPAAATALVLGLTIVLGGPTAFGLQQRVAAREQQRLNEELESQRDEALAQHRRAEANFLKALEAVDSMLTSVGDSRLEDVPRAAEVRRELLEQALAFYQGFLADRPEDPRLAREVVLAELRCARVFSLLGRFAQAEQAFATARADLASGRAAFEPVERALLGGEAARGMARLQLDSDRSALAEATLREALGELDAVRAQENSQAQSLRATLRGLLAEVLAVTGRKAESEAELVTQRDELELLVDGPDATAPQRLDLAHTLTSLGAGYLAEGRRDEALSAFLRALELFESLALAQADDVSLQADIARAHIQLAQAGSEEGQAWIEGHVSAALAALEPLSLDFPELPRLSLDLSAALVASGFERYESGDFAGALEADERACKLLARLVEGHPTVAEYRGALARAESNLYAVHLQLGQFQQALECLDRADLELARCLDSEPGRPELVETQTVLRINRGYALLELGRHREAVEAVTPLPDWPRWREHMGAAVVCVRALECLSEDVALDGAELAALEQRYVARALELLERGVELGFDDLEDLRDSPTWTALHGLSEFEALVEVVQARPRTQPRTQ
jgi:serine/threonine protein kinase